MTTLFQTATAGKNPKGRDSLDHQRDATEPPFFVGGCYSWRLDGPVVAETFPQFATKPIEVKQGS